MIMRCIIVDDEPLAIDLLTNYLERVENIEVIASFNDPVKVISYLKENDVDLVFLDIEMPNINGLELVKSIPNLPQFIFTTAYPKYALDGFELNATDYLVKPISFVRFLKAIFRAREKYKSSIKEKEVKSIHDDFIFVKSEYENVKLKTNDIIYIEGLKDYIKIYIKGATKSTLTKMSFKAVLNKLPAGKFIRIHRSYIVNVDYINSHQKNKIIILNKKRLPISETYKKEVLKKLRIE